MHEESATERMVEVHVKSLVTGERKGFKMPLEASLQQVWDEAYSQLEEARRDGDSLQCAAPEEGKSLADNLGLSLEQARDQRLCGSKAFNYEIKGPSGGARG